MSMTRNADSFPHADNVSARTAAIMEELVPALQGAVRGNRRLDLLISFALGRCSVSSRTVLQALLQDEPLPGHVAELLDAECPGYTTSLDATVPGENIILAVYQDNRERWAAVQRASAGEETIGHGASEVLARRIAALKALLPAMAMQPTTPFPARPASARPAPLPQRGEPAGEDASGPERKEPDRGTRQVNDWEILW